MNKRTNRAAHWTRRELLKALGASGVTAAAAPAFAAAGKSMSTRVVPKSGEHLPAVGVGTWQTFDVGADTARRSELKQVLQTFLDAGGTVVDSSPMYGSAEGVVGDLAAELEARDRLFFATKVWTRGREAGIRQMESSFRLFRTDTIDLMQVHNLVDWSTHLPILREWKREGRFRYIGVTHYVASAYAEIERLIENEDLDFVQINYSIGSRRAEDRLLPMARDHGVGIIVNRPYQGGSLFSRVRGRELPDWAGEIDCDSWGQFFLKFILGHPAVTTVIPGTGRVDHMQDNARAGYGRVPDQAIRERMAAYFRA